MLTGILPTELGSLTNLQYLTLYGNQALSGTVPSELGLLSALEFLLIHGTQITGAVPEEVCSLSSLHIADRL